MSGIHLGMNERLQYDNPKIIDAKKVPTNVILWMGITTNTLRHSHSTVINKNNLQIHPGSS